MESTRYLFPYLQKDLAKKMVFLGGPRQCGKTTLAKQLLQATSGTYFNWDDDVVRQQILKRDWSDTETLLVFDELHKYPRWKNWIKGLYDTSKNTHRFLVTGSARLDVYRRGGDSLLGRYHYWRLHPFTLSEIPQSIPREEAFKRLMTVGGFPEPFLDNDETSARRWRRERMDRVLRDDVRDLEQVRQIALMGLFVEQLRSRVGGSVVLHNIAQEIQVSEKTLKRWLEILERMYLLFVVRPYSKSLPRAILKPPKVYFFDNADVTGDEGAVFENLVATHLLKRIHFLEDSTGYRYELRYIRDKEEREVDFAITKDGVVEELYEAKWADAAISRSLGYYAERLKPRIATQVVGEKMRKSWVKGRLRMERATELFTSAWGMQGGI